jgi:hypothetical protein
LKSLLALIVAVAALVATVLSTSNSPTRADGPGLTAGRLESVIPTSIIREVPPRQWEAMVAAGMVREECPVQRREQLRRVDLNFVNFDGEVERGHLIVRDDTARSIQRIFDRLFEMKFPLRSMKSVEAFDGDVAASLRADNTSAYNCRRADQINAPFSESPHANGRAVDLNPRENPWMDLRCNCWTPSAKHQERTPGPGKILEKDDVWQLFIDEGWVWQNIKVPDYMHFDTGYPSQPLENP